MGLMKKILSNGYITILPIIFWNIFLISKLPGAFDPKVFNNDIPLFIIIGENIFRTIIFLMPLFFQLNITSSINKKGIIIYFFGIVLYFVSWLLLIYAPKSIWSTSMLGFSAPSYTPIIWLIGLSLLVKSYNLNWVYSKWHFILPSIAFSIFHISHTVYVYNRSY